MNYVTYDNLKTILQNMTSNINSVTNDTPIGTIISYMGTTAPVDYLICDGTIYNISQYNDLANFIKQQFGSYNYFGGDGTITFAVPDLRGEFLRGTGTNSHSGNGNGAEVGVHQDATTVGDFVVEAGGTNDMYAPLTTKDGFATNADSVTLKAKPTDSANTVTGRYYFAKSGGDSYTGGSGGNLKTTRPTNTSVLYCIKYNTSVLSTPENNYSTEEQRIGTWIDGKPLYQKTYNLISPYKSDGRVELTELPIGVNAENVVAISAIITSNDGAFTPQWINKTDDGYCIFVRPNRKIVCEVDSENKEHKPLFVTIQYTKTTD